MEYNEQNELLFSEKDIYLPDNLLFNPSVIQKHGLSVAYVHAVVRYFAFLKHKSCTLSNKRIAELTELSVSTISSAISILDKEGYVRSHISANSRGTFRHITIPEQTNYPENPLVKNERGSSKKTKGGMVNFGTQKKDININIKENKGETSFPDEFLDLWNKYGKVGDKLPSFKAWKKLSSTEQQKALGAVGAYVASTVKDDSENGVGKAWRPRRKHLSTWLNSRAWEEEVIVKEEPVETEEERRVRLRFEELQAQMNEYDRKIREFTEYWDARIFGDVSKLPEDAYIEIRDLNLEKSSITPAYQHYKMLYDRQTKK